MLCVLHGRLAPRAGWRHDLGEDRRRWPHRRKAGGRAPAQAVDGSEGMNPQTLGDIGTFLCGAVFGFCVFGCIQEVRANRRLLRLLRDVKSSPRVCAWCSRVLGTLECESTSHGLCDQCAAAMMKEFHDLNHED